MRAYGVAAFGLLMGLVPQSGAWAWSHPGHMAVAAIAWGEMKPDIRAEAVRLLKLNPEWNDWVAGAPPEEADEVGFIMAATWPDRIKFNHAYRDEDPRHPDAVPDKPTAAQNIGYADMFTHKYWHFIDTPFTPDGSQVPQTPAPNVVTRIVDFRAALADRTQSDTVRSYDLAWLEHLVGDVHQPLHAVTRYTADLPGDAGGNDIKLKASGAKELHAYWDGLLGSKVPKAPYAEAAETAMAEAQRIVTAHSDDAALVQVGDPNAWAAESLAMAEADAYRSPPVGSGVGPYTLDADYKAKARQDAELRIYLAGERLAASISGALAQPEQ